MVKHSARLWPVVMSLTVALLGTLSTAGAAHAVPGIPPCHNYVSRATWGDFHADVRPSGPDAIGYIAWLENIYVVTDRAGQYTWQTLINGKIVPGGGGNKLKSDNLHGALPRVLNGRLVYNAGDVFAVRIFHVAKNGQRYAAIQNQCRIMSR